ncbi:MAG: lipopolysaccharide biosynthesis protein [Proteobacteria bacterium]|nr:lipopolysaccharide biosynthesis protein [Pseudomonadota bacterium]
MSKNNQFSRNHLLDDLKGSSVRGGVATSIGQGIKFILNLGSTMILARLLTPYDFGLVAMVMAITSFINIFKDLGLSAATIQKSEINHDQVNTLFWINVAIGGLLLCITLALAPAVAWFYKDPRLTSVTAVLSIAFLFGGLTVQHEALLRRQMRLTEIVVIDILSVVAGILTATLCAIIGWGYWALVGMQIVTVVMHCAGVWTVSSWRPGWLVSQPRVRSMLKFGAYLTTFNFMNFFARQFDNILIGRFLGAEPLGIYSRAYSLLLVPIAQVTAPISSVAVPALSNLQLDPKRYHRYYLQAIKIIGYFSFTLVISLAALSEEVVALILGDQWMGAVPIFRIMAVAAMFQPILSTVGWIYVSLGQTRRMAMWGAIACPLIAVSFIIGLPWGVMGVATSYAACIILLAHPQLAFATKESPITPCDVYKVAARPFCVSVLVGIAIAGVRFLISPLHPLLTIFVCGLGGCSLFIIIYLVCPSVRNDLREIRLLLDSLWNKRLKA